jgi:hypothetical protein
MKKEHGKIALLTLLALTVSGTVGCGTSSDQTAIATETSDGIADSENEDKVEITSAGELTMEDLISMQEADDWTIFVAESSISDWQKYENVTESVGEYDDSLTGMYHAALSYGGKTYDFQVYYWRESTAAQYGETADSIDMILLMEPDTGDGIALFRSDWDEEQNKAQDLRGFLEKVYDITSNISFDMPQSDRINSEITLGEYRTDLFLSPFSGSLFLASDYSEPAHGEYMEEGWYSLGGIEELNEPDEEIVSYDNEELSDVNMLGNHMGYEKVESFQTDEFTGLLYLYEFELYTAADMAELPEDAQTTSSYWVTFLSEGEGEPIYMLFLNCEYFTKEEALDCAMSVRTATATETLIGQDILQTQPDNSTGPGTLPGADEIYPTIMVEGNLYEWRKGAAICSELPDDCVYYGELIHVEGETPNNNNEFVSVFSVSGQIYTVPETDTVVYLCLTTDWLENTVVVFDLVQQE